MSSEGEREPRGTAQGRGGARLVLVAAAEVAPLAGRRWPPPMVRLSALAELLAGEPPSAIGVAALAAEPDAFHVLARLSKLGYRGRVLALAPPLPRRALVEKELRAQGKGLRLRLVCLPALAASGG